MPAALAAALLLPVLAAVAEPLTIRVLDGVRLERADGPTPAPGDGRRLLDEGRTAEATVTLPPRPENQRDARRILATVTVRPVEVLRDGRPRPADVFTRLGSVSVVVPGRGPVELMRFTTGFGAAVTVQQDLTGMAPLLAGPTSMRLTLSTWTSPGWEAWLDLAFTAEGVGYRRPAYAEPLFDDEVVTDEHPRLSSEIVIPAGLARPRLRILSTGHSTDGGPANEFVSCSHVLRIDGREIARWRPWSEQGGALRDRNPWAGRRTIDGREVWSSDLDRSGWQPGTPVEPLVIPVPELTPGPHRVELEILEIRPAGVDHSHGYWRVSGLVMADEPWPSP